MKPLPLATASCPPLTPMVGNTMGDVVGKLVEVSGQYNECRAAVLVQP